MNRFRLGPRVPHQQEPVDQFVRALQRGAGGAGARALSLARGRERWRAWSRPLAAYGRNPLAAYFLSVGFDSILTRVNAASVGSLKGIIYRSTFVPWLRPCCGAEGASLGYAIAYVVLWGVILGEMYRRRIFIRI